MSISRSKRKRARAILDFERREDDELGFRKNDLITIISQKDDHCWIGELNGKASLQSNWVTQTQGARKLKKVQAKKLVKSNNSIKKMAKNQFLNWEKVLNCHKCNFTKKI